MMSEMLRIMKDRSGVVYEQKESKRHHVNVINKREQRRVALDKRFERSLRKAKGELFPAHGIRASLHACGSSVLSQGHHKRSPMKRRQYPCAHRPRAYSIGILLSYLLT